MDEEDVDDPYIYEDKNISLKGNILKINWYGNKQLRHFHFYKNGTLDYYDSSDCKAKKKGTIQIEKDCKVKKSNKQEIILCCPSVNRDYYFA